ncbi:hypothetical protein SKAU_G00112090 [Synaphobranchus kaupii]|uniref:Uncharacterized protein n=1 Tax=Synaphobranchus kaupii TaxID=118154 RepID=A0A9Q1G1S4_SYNKA|nr:hypothetical protein SKAU_G00112090 [Synaphobranchus kaupii]
MYHPSRNATHYTVSDFRPKPTTNARDGSHEVAACWGEQKLDGGGSSLQPWSGKDANAGPLQAVIFPGGHGVTKHLSTFNKDCKVHNDVERILKEFHRSQKPIGLASMAFLLACCVLPSLEVTMGCERDENSRWGCWPNTSMVQAMGCPPALHILPEAYVDENNKVISTPSMWETEYHYHYIFDGIGNMVKHVMRMTAKWSG